MDAEPIKSSRLELVTMPPSFVEALLEGRRDEAEAELGVAVPADWPDDHDARFLRFRLKQMNGNPGIADWLVRGIALAGSGERRLIGHIGFHGPPGVNAKRAPGAVEVGYTVFPEFRGRGYATEALDALIDWAHRERDVSHFIASVSPDNEPSLAIVHKLGFVETGSHWDDEDGLELEWELELSRD